MQLITISKIGYNHPRAANWSYGIYKVDLIDTKSPYNMSHVFKEQFGGDTRFMLALEKLNIKVIKTKDVYTGTGTPSITGVASLLDIESDEALQIIKDFNNKIDKYIQ